MTILAINGEHNMNTYNGTQEAVQAAADKIFVNLVRSKGHQDGTLYENPPQKEKVSVSEKTDEELKNVPILGYKKVL
jgi:hypothetical protein